MVHRQDARSAAERYAGDLVDADDPNMERERALVEDKQFQSLAVAAEQLDLMDIYEMPRHESTFADAAATKLQLALEERAVTVLEEVFHDEFDPSDYDDVGEALAEAPNGYGAENVLDHFDPVIEEDEVGDV